jgi:transposase
MHVGLEACATAHYWAREVGALGHEVRLMPAQYVKAYIKRNKKDAVNAEAICEVVSRLTMRFVPRKTAEQQAALLTVRDVFEIRVHIKRPWPPRVGGDQRVGWGGGWRPGPTF